MADQDPAPVQYVVAPRKSIMLPDRSTIVQGAVIPSDVFELEALERFVANGYAVRQEAFQFAPSGFSRREDDTYAQPGEDGWAPGPKVRSPRKWNRNPQDLMGKTLEQLNVLIYEMDPMAAAASTETAAVEILSRNYDPELDAFKAPQAEITMNGDPVGIREVPAVDGVPEAGTVREIHRPIFGDAEGEALT